ncbi:hypothetical protein AFERRI_400061 [Acidithiobacillus ferrivorans]|uniref:Uncharacterized protein n=1 Tax=Acidithiobacillus ferrivorans TaxID=160808 RepID=A0A060UPA9_9PROT|nr:hypothetical protein AFERRI_400061 [Acidithiobacillus ferrivorans]
MECAVTCQLRERGLQGLHREGGATGEATAVVSDDF